MSIVKSANTKPKRSPTKSELAWRKRRDQKVKSQLGLNGRTASHQMQRLVVASLLQETGRCTCYRCGTWLDHNNYSYEHIEEWLDSANPQATFFNLRNIEFVCKSCNTKYNRGRIDVRDQGKELVKPTVRNHMPLEYVITAQEYEDTFQEKSGKKPTFWERVRAFLTLN